MPTYTEIKKALDATWLEQPNYVRAIAARFYLGAETPQTLALLTSERPVARGHSLRPLLTDRQVQHIINLR